MGHSVNGTGKGASGMRVVLVVLGVLLVLPGAFAAWPSLYVVGVSIAGLGSTGSAVLLWALTALGGVLCGLAVARR